MTQSLRQTWRQAWLDLDRAVHGMELAGLLLCLLALLLCGLTGLAARLGWLSAPEELDRLSGMLLLWTGMMAAGLAVRPPGHPAFEGFGKRLPAFWQRTLSRVMRAGAAMVCLALVWASLRYIVLDLRLGSGSLLGIGSSAWLIILPLGFLLMALRLLMPVSPPDQPYPNAGEAS